MPGKTFTAFPSNEEDQKDQGRIKGSELLKAGVPYPGYRGLFASAPLSLAHRM